MQELIQKTENQIQDIFKQIDEIELTNTERVLKAFSNHKISEAHLNGTTGYGYGDVGREAIESMFCELFGTEEALVRTQFISGTHTISTTLFGVLRPGDTVVSINGKPYDTLDEVIGIRENPSSLKAFGVKYEQIDLKEGLFDIEAIKERASKINL